MANDAYASARLTLAGGRYLLPAWRTAMAPLTWAMAPGVNLATCNPEWDATENPNYPGTGPWSQGGGFKSVVDQWSGAAWDEARQELNLWGGGHANYAGNELLRWTPAGGWVRVSSPSGGLKTKVAGNVINLNDGQDHIYADGQPRSRHTYNNLLIGGDGELYATGGAQFSNGGSTNWFWRFNRTTAQWDRIGIVGTGVYVAYGSSHCNPVTGAIYSFRSGNDPARKFNPATLLWADAGQFIDSNPGAYCRTVYDPCFGGAIYIKDTKIYYWDETSATELVTSGTAPTLWGVAGFAYDAPRRRYLYWAGGGSIYTLTPPATGFNPRTAAWTWGVITPSNGSAPSAGEPTGTYGRFWCSATLGACGVVNTINETMNVFALE